MCCEDSQKPQLAMLLDLWVPNCLTNLEICPRNNSKNRKSVFIGLGFAQTSNISFV